MEQQVGTVVRASKRKDGAESIGLSLVQVVEIPDSVFSVPVKETWWTLEARASLYNKVIFSSESFSPAQLTQKLERNQTADWD